MAKIFVRINSNFLRSIRTSICMGNVMKFGVILEPFFGKSHRQGIVEGAGGMTLLNVKIEILQYKILKLHTL